MSTAPVPIFTIDEYLKIEREAEFRSEYIQGTIVAMAGAGRNHARIILAAMSLLDEQLDGTPCEPASSDMRVYVEKYGVLTYPDVVVTCGPDQYSAGKPDTLADATLIIEVLSPSTQRYDRADKFLYYRGLPSFAEYLLVSQDAFRVEHHTRQQDGSWLLREISDPDAVLELASIGCRFKLIDLYRRVRFEETA